VVGELVDGRRDDPRKPSPGRQAWPPDRRWLSGLNHFLWSAILIPAAFVVTSIWKSLAIAWIDRHQAWDRMGNPKAAPN
jgi:hypothetical protein